VRGKDIAANPIVCTRGMHQCGEAFRHNGEWMAMASRAAAMDALLIAAASGHSK
jgi:hypothetical protein